MHNKVNYIINFIIKLFPSFSAPAFDAFASTRSGFDWKKTSNPWTSTQRERGNSTNRLLNGNLKFILCGACTTLLTVRHICSASAINSGVWHQRLHIWASTPSYLSINATVWKQLAFKSLSEGPSKVCSVCLVSIKARTSILREDCPTNCLQRVWEAHFKTLACEAKNVFFHEIHFWLHSWTIEEK